VVLTNVLEIETSEMVIKAVREHLGVGYVLRNLVKNEIESGEFKELKVGVNLPEVELDLVYYEDYLTAVPAHFLKEYVLNHNNKL
jgi:DNA-binding transcriptional LysR family regulator